MHNLEEQRRALEAICRGENQLAREVICRGARLGLGGWVKREREGERERARLMESDGCSREGERRL